MGTVLANKAGVNPQHLLPTKSLEQCQAEYGMVKGQAQFDY
jgi:hypothetical protein